MAKTNAPKNALALNRADFNQLLKEAGLDKLTRFKELTLREWKDKFGNTRITLDGIIGMSVPDIQMILVALNTTNRDLQYGHSALLNEMMHLPYEDPSAWIEAVPSIQLVIERDPYDHQRLRIRVGNGQHTLTAAFLWGCTFADYQLYRYLLAKRDEESAGNYDLESIDAKDRTTVQTRILAIETMGLAAWADTMKATRTQKEAKAAGTKLLWPVAGVRNADEYEFRLSSERRGMHWQTVIGLDAKAKQVADSDMKKREATQQIALDSDSAFILQTNAIPEATASLVVKSAFLWCRKTGDSKVANGSCGDSRGISAKAAPGWFKLMAPHIVPAWTASAEYAVKTADELHRARGGTGAICDHITGCAIPVRYDKETGKAKGKGIPDWMQILILTMASSAGHTKDELNKMALRLHAGVIEKPTKKDKNVVEYFVDEQIEKLRNEMMKSVEDTKKNLRADEIIEGAINVLTGGKSGRFAKGWSIESFSEREHRVARGMKADFKTRAPKKTRS